MYDICMRRFIATFLILFFTMASFPLSNVAANQSLNEHVQSMSMEVDQNRVSADCCDLPMSSMHHGGTQCTMDCPALAMIVTKLSTINSMQFTFGTARYQVIQTEYFHFRPPIFN